MDVTLLEVHLEDASFTAQAPFAGRGDTGEADAPSEPTEDETDRPGLVPLLIGLAALAVLAYLLRRRRNGGTEPVSDGSGSGDATA